MNKHHATSELCRILYMCHEIWYINHEGYYRKGTISVSSELSRALPPPILLLQPSVKIIQPYWNTASPWETKTNGTRSKKRKQNNGASFLWAPAPSSICLPSFPASYYKGLIWPGCCGSRKNPEMASESSRKDYRISEVKTILVTFSSNPLSWQVGER